MDLQVLHVRFELIGVIRDVQTSAIGGSIRECRRLARRFGQGRWRKRIYRLLADPRAEKEGLIRVIDESGEDYLYPREDFVPIDLPVAASRALARIDRLQRRR